MLDLKFILNNIDKVKENCKIRNVRADLDRLVRLAEDRAEILRQVEGTRKEQNDIARSMKKPMEQQQKAETIARGAQLKTLAAEQEERLRAVESALREIQSGIPNMTHPDVPVGKGEEDSREIRKWGSIPHFDFTPRDHVTLGTALGILDFESGTKVTGNKFYFLRGDGALLELALIHYAVKKLTARGFTLHITPDLAKASILYGTGFNPRGEETQIYSVNDSDLCLIATSEITLAGKYSDTTVDGSALPLKLAGYSHCFRTESGAYGKASKGLYRVHQFSKVEMFVYTKPEDSDAMLEKLVETEEDIFRGLEIPYRLIECSSGDLGGPAYRKYDLEAWMPGRDDGGSYGEVTSASNCTDYQARRLNIRYKTRGEKGSNFVHTLNGTAIAVSRALIAILENNQRSDGSVVLPEALRPFMEKDVLQVP